MLCKSVKQPEVLLYSSSMLELREHILDDIDREKVRVGIWRGRVCSRERRERSEDET